MPDEKQKENDRSAYPLNRDFLASSRLNLQHQVWISSLGYHLHPDIPLIGNATIAEIGCGTGIWSLEAAKQVPSGAKIEAFDLSLAQCPPREWWPENVIFNKLDIFDPVPDDMVGKYDVVYIRHFICVLQSGDPMPLLSILMKLLKPGGYLQWQEWDVSTNTLVVGNTTGAAAAEMAPKMNKFMDFIRGPNSLQEQTSWVKSFHSRLHEAGAELIAHDQHWTAKSARLMKQEISYLGGREWCENLRARDPLSPEAAELDRLHSAAFDECSELERRSVIDGEMVTWVARKH